MNYIVMDMEWNQALTYSDVIKEPVFLTGEIIQIGAVKIDSAGNEIDKFNARIKPQFYTKLHPGVAQVTKITQTDMENGADFSTVFNEFCDWCGYDFAFLIWGTEDLVMLRKNMDIFGMDTSFMPPCYNIQNIFADQISKDTKQYRLSVALEMLREKAFDAHDALNDAMSTVLVCKHLDLVKGIAEYKEKVEHKEGIVESYDFDEPYDDMSDALADDYVVSFECPSCGEVVWAEKWVRQVRTTVLVSLAKCSDGQEFLIKLKFRNAPDNKLFVKRLTFKLTDELREHYKSVEDQAAVWSKYVTSAYDF